MIFVSHNGDVSPQSELVNFGCEAIRNIYWIFHNRTSNFWIL